MARRHKPKKQIQGTRGKELDAKLPGPQVRQTTDHEAAPPTATPYPIDEVEEASMDSFPASDPPGYGTGHA